MSGCSKQKSEIGRVAVKFWSGGGHYNPIRLGCKIKVRRRAVL